MSPKIHLLIPMSGQGTRYRAAGYEQPKPLIPISGAPMIERLLGNFPQQWPVHFVMAENHRETALPEALRRIQRDARQSYVPVHALGPLVAIEKGLEGIPENEAVFVSYCDYGMGWDPDQFERFVQDTECDACLVSYRGFHPHYLGPTKYAYSRLEGERVVEVREKGSFTEDRQSEYASTGGYYFRSARLLREALEAQRRLDLKVNGEFYTSLTVQALLQSRPKSHVRVFEIERFFQWGTPQDLKDFEYWEKSFKEYNKSVAHTSTVKQVLIPMAGLGSRFKHLTPVQKPFIPVIGQPMYQAAIESLPKGERTTIVTLRSLRGEVERTHRQHQIEVFLDETPPGQALSTEAGIPALNASDEVIVSSCDHGIVLSSKAWDEFHKNPGCDAAIFTITGFPGARRRPNAYAYVEPKNLGQERFPEVAKVSVKVPVSERPERDALLVGTFWFSSAALLQHGISMLKEHGARVNNELYLDSVFELLAREGKKVRMIPLDGYICWGDPESLAESVYWQETFCGRRSSPKDNLNQLTERF